MGRDFDFLFGAAQTFAQALSDMTDGQFTVAVSAAGEIAPALEALDAVADGKADCAHTALLEQEPGLHIRDGRAVRIERPAASVLAAGWRRRRSDRQAARRTQSHGLPGYGDTGAQMAGWFRKEIRSPADLKGLKVRIGGFAGKVFEALGAMPVAVPKDDILAALSKGSLDAFEWVGPYDDEKFSDLKDGGREPISKVAPYYYYPGWWKGDMQLHLVVAMDKFLGLPKSYQASLRAAAALANGSVRTKYDAANPGAVKRLVVGGAQLRLFSQEVLDTCYRTATQLYAQLAEQNPNFKTIAESFMAFRADEYLWWQVAEYSFDNFMIRERRAKS